jgi:hypothetical protein
MKNIEVGSVWNLLVHGLRGGVAQVPHRIEEVNDRLAVVRSLGNGRQSTVLLSALRAGRRGAKLVSNPDGTAAPQGTPKPRTRINPRMRDAVALLEQGWSTEALSERYGVRPGTIRQWAVDVRRAEKGAEA